MDWKEIAAVSGKSGLFNVVKPTRAGFILESIDEEKKRFIAGPNTRVSVLHEISIYTEEDSIALSDVMIKIKKDKGTVAIDPKKADGAELMDFLKSVVPDYDEEKVYASDVKKLISWYAIIDKEYPNLLEEVEEETAIEEATVVEETTNEEASAKKEDEAPKDEVKS